MLAIRPRHRRKRAGLANLQYIRHDRTYLLLATGPFGAHPYFEREVAIRDAREIPIRYAGYEISYRGGRVWVRIERGTYKKLRAYFADIATRRRAPVPQTAIRKKRRICKPFGGRTQDGFSRGAGNRASPRVGSRSGPDASAEPILEYPGTRNATRKPSI